MDEPQLEAEIDQANALIAAGDFAHAEALLTEVTAAYPGSAKAWKDLGIAENKNGNREEAKRHLLRSLEIDDMDEDAWVSLGGVYFSTSHYDDALRCYREALSRDRENTFALVNYLTMAGIVGDDGPALSDYGKEVKEGERRCAMQITQEVNLPWCYYDLGQLLFFEGQHDESRSVIREAFGRSSDWQLRSARLPYERLAQEGRFAEAAYKILDEFARYSGNHQSSATSESSPEGAMN